ncbi:MAG: hypothetical protein HYU88_12540 [Chloroflexi bacterium]|nr:hypothetical protein [Chloroflexota bacterium]MBI4504133.1 hypothetical protein [Chloroflexota bacterium]
MKKEFVIERDGRSFVLYAGLLDEAHRKGLKAIRTALLQAPTAENEYVAICQATVETEQGTFMGIGDASPDNVPRLMRPHLLRMAETRAKARALRDAVNIGVAALEELGEPEASGEVEAGGWREGPASGLSEPAGPAGRRGQDDARRGNPATPAQLRAIHSIARERLRLSDAELDQRALSLFGSRVGELTKSQASQLIDALRGPQRGPFGEGHDASRAS